MKKSLWSISTLVLLALCFACSTKTSPASAPKPEVVVEYATFDNHPLQLVYDPNTSRVILRIRFDPDDIAFMDDKYLAFLREEVFRLTAKADPVKLGNLGYTFKYLGGQPIWGPHSLMMITHRYDCLFFAEKASMTGKTITAWGDRGGGWDGYRLWKPRGEKK